MTRRDLLRAVGGLSLGSFLLIVYFGLIGFEDVRSVLLSMPLRRVVSILAVGLIPLVFWGLGLHLVLDRLGRRVRIRTAVLLFSMSGFLNSITPFGQAGGDPVTAAVFTRIIGTDFETGLAAIGSLNAINRLATLVLGLLGIGYLWTYVSIGSTIRDSALLLGGLTIAVALLLVFGWRFRQRLIAGGATALTPLIRSGTRLLPGVAAPSRREIEQRGHRFVGAIDRLATDPRRLAMVFGLSVAGHLGVASSLWVALISFGFDASFAVVLLAIPIAKLGGIAPTPGGMGTAQPLLAMLLVSTTPVDPLTAGAAVLLYRASSFWLPSLIGGFVTGWFTVVDKTRTEETGQQWLATGDRDVESRPVGVASSVESTPSPVPRVLLTIAVLLATLVGIIIHRGQLIVEPENIVVHVIRDTSLLILSFIMTWLFLQRLPLGLRD